VTAATMPVANANDGSTANIETRIDLRHCAARPAGGGVNREMNRSLC